MKAIVFPEANFDYKLAENNEGAKIISEPPTFRGSQGSKPCIVLCMEVTDKDLERMRETKMLWTIINSSSLPEITVQTEHPFIVNRGEETAGDMEGEKYYTGKEHGDSFERLVYWATHSGWRYCQGGKQCGNEPIIKLSHFNSMVKDILKDIKEEAETTLRKDTLEAEGLKSVLQKVMDYFNMDEVTTPKELYEEVFTRLRSVYVGTLEDRILRYESVIKRCQRILGEQIDPLSLMEPEEAISQLLSILDNKDFCQFLERTSVTVDSGNMCGPKEVVMQSGTKTVNPGSREKEEEIIRYGGRNAGKGLERDALIALGDAEILLRECIPATLDNPELQKRIIDYFDGK